MQTWTDSSLQNVNTWSQIVGLCLLLLACAAAYAFLATQRELARRANENLRLAQVESESKTKKMAEMEQQLAAARTAEEAAHALAKQVQEKPVTGGRTINAAQKAAFVAATAGTKKGTIAVEIFLGGLECHDYANQIREMLVAAGFDSGSEVQQSLSGLPLGKGIIVWARDGHKLPPFTAEVLNALVGVGLEIQTHADPNNPRIPADGLLITVGAAE